MVITMIKAYQIMAYDYDSGIMLYAYLDKNKALSKLDELIKLRPDDYNYVLQEIDIIE